MAELRAALERRGLHTTGKRADLQERLLNAVVGRESAGRLDNVGPEDNGAPDFTLNCARETTRMAHATPLMRKSRGEPAPDRLEVTR